jgi:hypothetical protein
VKKRQAELTQAQSKSNVSGSEIASQPQAQPEILSNAAISTNECAVSDPSDIVSADPPDSFVPIMESLLAKVILPEKDLQAAKHLIMLANKRQSYANKLGLRCDQVCSKCRQAFLSVESLDKHTRQKTICTRAKFMLELVKFKSLNAEQKQQFEAVLESFKLKKVRSELASFQSKWKKQLLEVTDHGICGNLLDSFGKVIHTWKTNCPTKSISQVGDFSVSLKMIEILLSGILFNSNSTTTKQFISPSFVKGDTWIAADHLHLLTSLLNQTGYFDATGQIKPVLLSPGFYEELRGNSLGSMEFLLQWLTLNGLLVDSQCLAQVFLLPVCIGAHWILVYVNCLSQTYWVLDPYRPSDPSVRNISIGQFVANQFAKALKQTAFSLQMPRSIKKFPKQSPEDLINCGVFVFIYCLAFIDEKQAENRPLPHFKTPGEYRLLMAIWLLTMSVPSLYDANVDTNQS